MWLSKDSDGEALSKRAYYYYDTDSYFKLYAWLALLGLIPVAILVGVVRYKKLQKKKLLQQQLEMQQDGPVAPIMATQGPTDGQYYPYTQPNSTAYPDGYLPPQAPPGYIPPEVPSLSVNMGNSPNSGDYFSPPPGPPPGTNVYTAPESPPAAHTK